MNQKWKLGEILLGVAVYGVLLVWSVACIYFMLALSVKFLAYVVGG